MDARTPDRTCELKNKLGGGGGGGGGGWGWRGLGWM